MPGPGGAPGTCQVCGAAPAVSSTFRHETGAVLVRFRRRQDGEFCRDCGRAIGRSFQNRTLLTGWWGLISLVTNLYSVAANAAALIKLRGLGAPQGGDPGARREPGRPVFLRVGVIVPLLIVAVVVFVVVRTPSRVNGLEAGDCFSMVGSRVDRVSCSAPNEGKVVAVADDEDACPASADQVLVPSGSRGGPVLCVIGGS
jgi:hypothetical protein